MFEINNIRLNSVNFGKFDNEQKQEVVYGSAQLILQDFTVVTAKLGGDVALYPELLQKQVGFNGKAIFRFVSNSKGVTSFKLVDFQEKKG